MSNLSNRPYHAFRSYSHKDRDTTLRLHRWLVEPPDQRGGVVVPVADDSFCPTQEEYELRVYEAKLREHDPIAGILAN